MNNCINTLVFGSSLTRDLDANLLSKRGKTFRVFTKGGARAETIVHMIEEAVQKGEVCTSCVRTVFVVAGGNDAENIKSQHDVDKVKSYFEKMVSIIITMFSTDIQINIVSLMPRRTYGFMHLQNIFGINEFLRQLCDQSDINCRFIKMFSKFLLYKHLYFSRKDVYLNEKLFVKD